MKYVIVGTAGHIDHGKSALVQALTGTDPDRLEEEKRRGITIDLGFAHLDLGDGLRIGFIDVPGHERFVKNMLAGVGGIDLVLLVVAADESLKPQTREHLDICKLIEVGKGMVVITKADLVEREILELVKLEIQDFVAGSFLEGAPIVTVSSRTGEGLNSLRNELRRLGAEVDPKPVELPFRLPVDRTFVMKGFGAVVTGTLITGRIQKDAEVEIYPLGRRLRVRGIEVHNQAAERAAAGQRTALNLAGIEAREIARGMTVAEPGLFHPGNRLDCALSLLPSGRPLKNHAKVHFHCLTGEAVGEVVLLEGKDLRPGARIYAQLRLAEPGLYLPGDHFIIRQFSPVTTIGGGVVLDCQPAAHRLNDPRVQQFLHVMESGSAEARLLALVEQSGEAAVSALAARLGQHLSEILRTANTLAGNHRLIILGQPPNVFVSSEHFEGLTRRALEQMEQFHRANPLVAGVSREELRGRLSSRVARRVVLPSPALFNSLIQSLATQGKLRVEGETVRLKGREVQMTSEETLAREEISRAFEKAGLAVPSAKQLLGSLRVDRARAEKILHLLLNEKVLVKVAEDLIFHREALAKLREMLARQKAQSNRIDVPFFKEMTGLSRKYAIPLLEYLDRERVTRRQGDERIIL